MTGWHHWLNGHEIDHTPWDHGGWHAAVHGGHKESDMT